MKTKLILMIFLSLSVAFAQEKGKVKLPSEDGSKFIEVEVVPSPLEQIAPVYPQLARLSGIEGKVYVKALIDEKGNVIKTEIMKSDNSVLDGAAVDAVKKSKFSPALDKQNKPVKVWVVVPMSFKLNVDKKAEGKLLKYDELGPPPSNVKDEDPDINAFIPVEKFPEMIEAANPVYPEIAKKNNIGGKVFVKVLVDKNGTPKKAIVAKSDNDIFNQSAVDAALKSKFTPAINKGEAIAVWIVLPYKFNLDDKKDSTENLPTIPDITWLITSTKPEYPAIALEKKLEGIVSFKVLFNKEDMSIAKIDLIKGTDEILNKEALNYVKKEIKTIIEYFESTRQKYIKQHPKESAGGEIKDAAIIRIDYRLEE